MERRRFIRDALIVTGAIVGADGLGYLVPTCVSHYENEIKNRPQQGSNNQNPPPQQSQNK